MINNIEILKIVKQIEDAGFYINVQHTLINSETPQNVVIKKYENACRYSLHAYVKSQIFLHNEIMYIVAPIFTTEIATMMLNAVTEFKVVILNRTYKSTT